MSRYIQWVNLSRCCLFPSKDGGRSKLRNVAGFDCMTANNFAVFVMNVNINGYNGLKGIFCSLFEYHVMKRLWEHWGKSSQNFSADNRRIHWYLNRINSPRIQRYNINTTPVLILQHISAILSSLMRFLLNQRKHNTLITP